IPPRAGNSHRSYSRARRARRARRRAGLDRTRGRRARLAPLPPRGRGVPAIGAADPGTERELSFRTPPPSSLASLRETTGHFPRKRGKVRLGQPQGPRRWPEAGTEVVAGRGATDTAARGAGRPIFIASSVRARTRLPVLGWVANRLSAPRPASGLMMNSWPDAGLRSAVGLWIRLA